MARGAGLAGRSAAEWGIRGLLAAVAAICGYVSVSQVAAYGMRTRAPDRAHAIAPGDGRITGQAAQAIAADVQASPAARRRADALAMLALRQDPTAVSAASALALNRQIGGDTAGARRLFGYAQRLSRRELQVQIWAIEDAVSRGDIAGALTHYDIALRTSRNAPDLLFPILAAAIADPTVRQAVAARLAARPPWGGAFVDHVAANGADPRSTAQLFFALRRAAVPLSASASAAIINALIVAGHEDEAWRYYASIRRGADRRRSRDPRFTDTPATPSVLDWTLVDEGAVAASVQRGPSGSLLDFTAPPSVGGQVARQMQLLPPGTYRLSGRSAGIDQPTVSRPYWSLTCRKDGRELGRIDILNSAQAGGVFGGGLNVPANCPVQTLTLVARPSASLLGLTGQIEEVRLAPAQREGDRP